MPFRLFVFLPRNNTTRKDEITPREKTKLLNKATRKDEITITTPREKTKKTPRKMTRRRHMALKKTKF